MSSCGTLATISSDKLTFWNRLRVLELSLRILKIDFGDSVRLSQTHSGRNKLSAEAERSVSGYL